MDRGRRGRELESEGSTADTARKRPERPRAEVNNVLYRFDIALFSALEQTHCARMIYNVSFVCDQTVGVACKVKIKSNKETKPKRYRLLQ